MRNCVVFTFFIVAQIVKGGRGRRRVSAGRLALGGGHVVREECCNSTRSQEYSRPWITSLYRYKFQIISSIFGSVWWWVFGLSSNSTLLAGCSEEGRGADPRGASRATRIDACVI